MRRYRNSEGYQELRYILGKSYPYNPGCIIRDTIRYQSEYPEDDFQYDVNSQDYAAIQQIKMRNNGLKK